MALRNTVPSVSEPLLQLVNAMFLLQDTMNPGKQMIIIRSLVSGGMAERDGRLEPGDRLISVNGINLFNATLEEAVQALKGTARGVVTLRVLKPQRFSESSTDYDVVCVPVNVTLP